MNTYFYCAKITKYGLFGSSSFVVNGTFSIGTDVNVIEYAKAKVMKYPKGNNINYQLGSEYEPVLVRI